MVCEQEAATLCSALLATAANKLGVLGISLASAQPHTPPDLSQDDFLDRSIGQMNNLIQGVAICCKTK